MQKQGVLTVISGFSGSGKGTVVKQLVDRYDYALSISATTRSPRTGEEDGSHYFFVSIEQFEELIQKEGLLEWAKYVDNYYGTPKQYVLDMLESGRDVLLEIEMQGGLSIKEKCPDAILVFMTPPSAKELRERLVNRNTEDLETINKRLNRASEEIHYIDQYDYLVINDNLDDCIHEIHGIITNEKKRLKYNLQLAKDIKQDFNNI